MAAPKTTPKKRGSSNSSDSRSSTVGKAPVSVARRPKSGSKPSGVKKTASTKRSTASRGAAAAETSTRKAPPAASVAAAQKVLRSVERKEGTLRAALKRQKKTLQQLTKNATAHGETVKSLKSELKKVKKTRKSVSADLK